MKIFTEGLTHLPEQISENFTSQFSDEILKNVFNETRRYELSLKEEDILLSKKSDRGFSIDEQPEYEGKETDPDMRLKKTTILTGNHTAVKRNRAQSENEIFTSNFKGNLAGSSEPKT